MAISAIALEKELSQGLGVGIRAIEPIGGGGNNRLFRAIAHSGACYAVKVYWRDAHDNRDRLATEFGSLAFMWNRGLRCIPAPVFSDSVGGFAVYEYVQGEKVDSDHIGTGEIGEVVSFLARLKELSFDEAARSLALASDACFSVGDIVSGVYRRLSRLRRVSGDSMHHRDLGVFLERELTPFFEQATANAVAALSLAGCNADSALPQAEWTLSPSDYGFHNAVRRGDGTLVFLDFEYFGWDDPAKMVADFILHPAMRLSLAQKQYFLERMIEVFGVTLRDRVRLVYSLHGVAWCVRLLNEFVPEDAKRREFALHEPDGGRLDTVVQLQKARDKLAQVRQDHVEVVQ